MAATKAAAAKAAERAARRAEAEARREEPIPPESPPQEAEWATSEDLPDAAYVDFVPPDLGKMVRVRFLDNLETAELGSLPDLLRFSELMGERYKIQEGKRTDPLSPEEARELRREQVKYGYLVAHVAVIAPDTDLDANILCQGCGLSHPRSLWTLRQAKRLTFSDLGLISFAAENGEALSKVRPLSSDQTEPDSSPPVSSGESTPQTSLESDV